MMPHQRRSVTQMEFLTPDGIRLELDADGWRLINPRQLGERQLAVANRLIERAEATVPPCEEGDDPPTIAELGEYAAKQLDLRLTHRRFRHGR